MNALLGEMVNVCLCEYRRVRFLSSNMVFERQSMNSFKKLSIFLCMDSSHFLRKISPKLILLLKRKRKENYTVYFHAHLHEKSYN